MNAGLPRVGHRRLHPGRKARHPRSVRDQAPDRRLRQGRAAPLPALPTTDVAKTCIAIRKDGKAVDIDGDYTETLARIDSATRPASASSASPSTRTTPTS